MAQSTSEAGTVTPVSPPPMAWDSIRSGVKRWALAAVAACLAESATFPIDFCKTRLQLQNEMGRSLTGEVAAQRLGMVGTFRHIAATEGLRAMYGGLPAAALRQAVYGGIGVGLYAPVRDLVVGRDVDPKTAPLWQRIVSGMITGGVGQAVASPTDVVKVRLQADGRLKAVGKAPRYQGTFDAFRRIPREEGFRGFYKGVGPSVQRAAIINGCGIASYDHTKQVLIRLLGTDEGASAKVLGSLVSGLVSALVSTPFDVVKTRIMNQPHGVAPLYTGPVDCALKTVRAEGPLALYKGFAPAYVRLAPWQLVFFYSFEEINKLAGLREL